MRDAFGGEFTIKLLLVFIFIYVAFTAVSLNYAKAFKIKNKVIDLLEENEVINLSQGEFSRIQPKLNQILESANYVKTCKNGNGQIISEEGSNIGYCYNGIVLEIENIERIDGAYSTIITYNVYTYADWNLGALNKILALGGKPQDSEEYVTGTWEIIGEAKVVSREMPQ